MNDRGRYVWQRHDLKPDRHEREMLNYVETQHQKDMRGIESLRLSWSPQIISLPLLNALADSVKLK